MIGDFSEVAYEIAVQNLPESYRDIEDVKLNIGKMAIWRIKTHENFPVHS